MTTKASAVPRPSLEGVLLKLERADERFKALGDQITGFLYDPDSYALALQHDHERVAFVVEHARQPPPQWGVLIGECIYNFHSALDQLAYQLAVANQPRGIVPGLIAESSAFPIFNSGPRFRQRDRRGHPTRSSGLYKIRGASPGAQAIIERLQPYHRWKEPRARALWQLHELSRVDKHRHLHVTHSSLEASHFELTGSGPIAIGGYESFTGPLKPGAVVARWHVRRVGPGRTHMNVKSHLSTDIAFDQRSPARSIRGESVPFVLAHIAAFIGDTLLPQIADELGIAANYRPTRIMSTLNGEIVPHD
jgi:hypothetical protein